MIASEINDTIARLNLVMDSTPAAQSVGMGAALYGVCVLRGLASLDQSAGGRHYRYRGLAQIQLQTGLLDWEFQVEPPHA